jgi:acetyl-CoA acetyltransferase
MSIKDRYAIVGLGVTKQGRLPGLSINAVRADVARLAIEDAGLGVEDIGGYIYQVGVEEMGRSLFQPGDVPKRLGMRPNFIWHFEAGGVTCVSSILAAGAAVEAGTADYVVCVYGSCDLSHILTWGARSGGRYTDGAFGMFTPGAAQALSAKRHMHEYGTTQDQLGAIAVTHRENAQKRPDAYMHGRPMTLEDYHNSGWIVEPYHKYDMCLVNDGGIAFVVTTAERAKDLKSKPVYVMGVGFGQQVKQAYEKQNFTTLDVGPAKEAAFKMAGITLEDIDVAELYDCFTGTVLFETEDYGFCKKGEGGPFWEEGHARLDGKIPINTNGGNLSWGYNQGFGPVAEAVRQLRGEGGETQVKDAEIALATGHGTNTTGVMEYGHGTIILRR